MSAILGTSTDYSLDPPLFNSIESTVNDFFSVRQNQNDFLTLDDPFGSIYQNLLTKAQRLQQGEFYTPQSAADLVFNRIPTDRIFHQSASAQTLFAIAPKVKLKTKGKTIEKTPLSSAQLLTSFEEETELPHILDPACGSGVFLLSAFRVWRNKSKDSPEHFLRHLTGFDINPIAVLATRANLFLELFKKSILLAAESPDALLQTQKQIEFFCDRCQKKDPFNIFLFDSINLSIPDPTLFPPTDSILNRKYDLAVGNPPWITWDQLPAELREKTKPLWRKYGLFDLSGRDARYGGAKKDLAALMFCVIVDRFLKTNGFLSMFLPMSLLRNDKAGRGFRQFRLGPNGEFLRILELNDFSQCALFPNVQSPAASILLQKGAPTVYPVPCNIWTGKEPELTQRGFARPSLEGQLDSPLNFSSEFTPTPKITSVAYQARLGANTAGANGIFWFKPESIPQNTIFNQKTNNSQIIQITKKINSQQTENYSQTTDSNQTLVLQQPDNLSKTTSFIQINNIDKTKDPSQKDSDCSSELIRLKNMADAGKKAIPIRSPLLEKELLFPLLRWRDVERYKAHPSAWILIPQDPLRRRGLSKNIMQRNYPYILAYLSEFETVLKERAAYKKFQANAEFWSMYNICPETFAPIKVVWRRMDSKMNAAVLLPDPITGKPVIPQETCTFIVAESIEEADYLAALLNSDQTAEKLNSCSRPGTKSFGAPNLLQFLNIEKFDSNSNIHKNFAYKGKKYRIG